MNVEKIRSMRLAEPFQPFTLILREGEPLFVKEPFRLAISPVGRNLIFALPKGGFAKVDVADVIDAIPGRASSDRKAS